MPTWAWILIAVAVVVVIAALAYYLWWSRRQRSEQLRRDFGPEYERTVSERGSRGQAEAELERRQEKRRRLDIVPLEPAERTQYLDRWRELQTRFVDEPSSALADGDRLVTEVMRSRGYPMDEFEQRAADVSVDHPEVVEHYRAAHGVYLANDRGEASTEDLRQGVVHYRALFHELLETRVEATEEVEQ